ncbi:FadR/GntR family transcriptional regulator [Streptomyces sp. SDT5-1]|uniref:FadR/GntR family transcriptional regulator n=1 Tax=Streptomyces sp. SDT5-1 TaxID=3406418 RepID=UPI003FD0C101
MVAGGAKDGMPSARSERSTALLRALEDEVDRAVVRPDRRLPPERVLSETLGCTRGELRRLMAHLEREGKVTRHVGRGTYATTPGEGVGAPAESHYSPAALMTTCLLFEPEVAAVAAMSASQADIRELRQCIERAATLQGSWEELEDWDISMHRGFAAATHNPDIVAMVDALNSARNSPLWSQLKSEGVTPATRLCIQQEHAEIVDAISSRDRSRASAAMARHIRSVRCAVLRLDD